MASQTNSYTMPEVVYGYPMQPPSPTDPPRPIVTNTSATHEHDPSCKEHVAFITPCCGGLFTFIAVMAILHHFVDNAHFHAKFAIQSIVVSPSATWHVDFLVDNPSSIYSINYGDDETAVRIGPLNAAVLNTSYERKSPSHTAFSVDFVAEDNPNDVVFEQLDIKLKGVHKVFSDNFNNAGHIDIRCHNLTRDHDNVKRIQCHSSFTKLKILPGNLF